MNLSKAPVAGRVLNGHEYNLTVCEKKIGCPLPGSPHSKKQTLLPSDDQDDLGTETTAPKVPSILRAF